MKVIQQEFLKVLEGFVLSSRRFCIEFLSVPSNK